jgi:hypothetical protein
MADNVAMWLRPAVDSVRRALVDCRDWSKCVTLAIEVLKQVGQFTTAHPQQM